MNGSASNPTGKVYLIGAGPGDPELITVKGQKALGQSHVVVYDYLANPALLEGLPPQVHTVYVGKRHGQEHVSQEQINRMLVEFAKQGATVARLKGGDPFIFGRGGEEALACAEAGVPFEVIPGVTAATAVSAYAGIPLTQRGINTSVTFVTGSEDPNKPDTQIHWDSLAKAHGTIVFFMGTRRMPQIITKLIEAGRAPTTPVAVIRWGTHPCQQTVTGTLETILDDVKQAAIAPPALIVVGEVVALRERIGWFEKAPLFGKKVLVTRAADQQGTLTAMLNDLGAEVTAVPTLQILPPTDADAMNAIDAAIDNLNRVDWLVLTSANGVKHFFTRMAMHGKDVRALGNTRIAVVGTETANTLAAFALHPDLTPEDQKAEGLAEALIATGIDGKRVVLAQADKARPVLADMLKKAGADLLQAVCYQSVPVDADDEAVQALKASDGGFDYATFTSGATVNNLKAALGEADFQRLLAGARIAAIGPVTAQAATDAGLTVAVQPGTPSIAELVSALCADAARSPRC